jgi:pyoverdine/dityrosine biosynthesis protein Dit1
MFPIPTARPNDSPARATAERVLGLLLRRLRTLRDPDVAHGPDEIAREHHLRLIESQVLRGEGVLLALPAFPCKSPNPRKILGSLPDHAERLALRSLARLTHEIAAVHPPGARILICSDGHVFSDLIGVSDATVTAYGRALKEMIDEEGISTIDLFDLQDVWPSLDYEDSRNRLVAEYGVDVEALRAEVHSDASTLRLYRGITRFLVEDGSGPTYTGTRSALLRDCRRRAYGVIQRSRAWGDLVSELHPRHVRLSIHPQHPSSTKLGLRLVAEDDGWTTPWHAVAVQRSDGSFYLRPRQEAERVGRLVYVDDRPSYVRIPSLNESGTAGNSGFVGNDPTGVPTHQNLGGQWSSTA